MKILNLYTGIGGNRKLWTDVEVIAVEFNPQIAEVYQRFFPDDTVIVADAHNFLLKHFKDGYDFIWASPPCPTHSDIRRCGVHKGQYEAKYPAMELYQEIILLQHFAPKNVKWCVENVKPYYDYLIEPTKILGRHPFWTNFKLYEFNKADKRKHTDINGMKSVYGFDISDTDISDKRKSLRNCVNPELGLHILECVKEALGEKKYDKDIELPLTFA